MWIVRRDLIMEKRNWIIVALCVAIVGMGIGYAALAQNLQISATANITGEWDVKITNFEFAWGTEDVVGTATFDGTSATAEVDLPYPGAIAIFHIRVENHGNIEALFQSITGLDAISSAEPSEIRAMITDGGIPLGFTLTPGGIHNHILQVEWVVEDGVESTIPDVKTKTVTFNLNYVQNT